MPPALAFEGCGGQNRSPQLGWKNFPRTAKSFAVIAFDPDAPTGSGFHHWVLANIPGSVTSLGENGPLPAGAVQGMTDFGFSHYGGPCPPRGDQPHRYRFTVYALDVTELPGVGASTTGAMLVFLMRGHLLAQGTVEGRFGL
jgi:Raf kinase inhibitor-like YbhB/YbcL family protein